MPTIYNTKRGPLNNIVEGLSNGITASVNKTKRKVSKTKTHILNGELAILARKKHLKQALKCFKHAEAKGFVYFTLFLIFFSSKMLFVYLTGMKLDAHSYTNILNGYVRCGDMSGALEWFKGMIDSSINPNIVTLTTLLKGFCEAGQLKEASDIFFNYILGIKPAQYAIPPTNTVNNQLLDKALENKGYDILINVRSVNTFLRFHSLAQFKNIMISL